jgi:DNA mismatch endonuclease, patch repair protein
MDTGLLRRGRRSLPKQSNRLGLIVDEKTSARLGRIRQRNTEPEVVVRRVLRELGHSYRISNRDLPGSPDVANRRARWAVFVNGCFWHRHSGCIRTTTPKRNRAFWLAKFRSNRARDRRVVMALHARGYRVVVVWECDTKKPKRLRKMLARLS